MDATERERLIARYEQAYEAVRAALDGASEGALDARPASDAWSAREIVHHLADSEMTSAIRLRRLIAEDAPVIVGYDEERFARDLFYDRPIGSSLDAFRASRETTAQILRRLRDEDWGRAGWHTESGLYTVETWLETYASHGIDHAEQIRHALVAARA